MIDQLNHKSELLDKVKHLLSRAAMNEKSLRQRVNIHFSKKQNHWSTKRNNVRQSLCDFQVQQLESKQTLSTIPECYVTAPTPE